MAANSRVAVAAHIVAVLAHKKGEFVSSAFIAGSVNTHPTVIRRILSALVRAGIVATEEGKAGGAKLVKRPDQITLWDLSAALGEQRLFAVHKNTVNPKCPISCRMKDVLAEAFGGAEKAARARLERVSVSDLLADVGVA
jgi:Rrf2 family protein